MPQSKRRLQAKDFIFRSIRLPVRTLGEISLSPFRTDHRERGRAVIKEIGQGEFITEHGHMHVSRTV